jgi:signal transduction histidine kinase
VLSIRSSVGSPIIVEGQVWGAVFVHSKDPARPLARDTEGRLTSFAELVATAMSNAQARAEVHRLAVEQAALRRVATMVVHERPAVEVFAAVAEEVGRVLHLEDTRMVRFERDGTATVVASWGHLAAALPVGASVSLERESVSALVYRTGRPVRIDDFTNSPGRFAASLIVVTADEERRRVVRDLHDGAQQRLVHTVITLKLARRALEKRDDAAPLLEEALGQAQQANVELRELSHGILPAVLARGGLRAGVHALASRTPVPVEIDVSVGRLPAAVEATAYFVVAEGLTNVVKHSRAERAEVTADVRDGTLRVRVRDDGVGGAQPEGSGLLGLADRVAALDGRLRVDSPADGGTLVAADIPMPTSTCGIEAR